jgi:hypothetical protein
MKTTATNPEIFESTYALIMRSEEKQRSRFEILVYTVLVASTTFAVAQFGRQATLMPSSIAHVSTIVPATERLLKKRYGQSGCNLPRFGEGCLRQTQPFSRNEERDR